MERRRLRKGAVTAMTNKPEWITFQQEFGTSFLEEHSIDYNFNIRSDGDCVVWLQKIDGDRNAMYRTKPKYFTTTDEACEWLQRQTKAYTVFMKAEKSKND